MNGLAAMVVSKIDRQWFVTDGETQIGPFPSNAAAWAWLDKNDPEHAEAVDRNARIRDAFAER